MPNVPSVLMALALSWLVRVIPAQAPARPAAPKPAAAVPAPAPKQALTESETQQLVKSYGQCEHWAMRAIVLLSLGSNFHPCGCDILLAAIKDRDAHMLPFALEVLRRMPKDAAAAVATVPLMAELIARVKHKNQLVRERVHEALTALAPEASCKEPAAWARWWGENSAVWTPKPWVPPVREPRAGGTVAGTAIERAFDLRDAGLEVVFVLDTTGSMQVAIDAARDAIDDVSALLAGITPKLRLGLVHYKDLEDMGDGAELLVPLTKDHKQVREKLAKLRAGGGGDMPERVEKGIEVALGKETGWTKDANRMMVVVGDAPPHHDAEDELLAMVKRAHDEPFAKGKKQAVTGGGAAKVDLRPFITSAIATNQAAKPSFDAIAKAGGGASVLLDLGGPGGGKAAAKQRPAPQLVAEHVLLLAFGQSHSAELRVFVEAFFDYHNAGAF